MTGLVYDLDEREYHAHPTSLSVSGAKTLLKSPARFAWERENAVHKDVFDFGSAAHQLVLGTGPGIAIIPATSRAKADQEAHKAAKEEARTEGKIPVTADDFTTIQAMADQLSSHTMAMKLLSEGDPEVSAFAVDQATGVERRCRYDWIRPTVAVDYKTASSVQPRDLAGRYGVVKKWGYDMQAAWYLDLGRDLDLDLREFVFIFQAKDPPYSVVVARVPDDDLWEARQANRLALEMFRDCTETGIWPGPVPDDECVVLSLTDQTYFQESA